MRTLCAGITVALLAGCGTTSDPTTPPSKDAAAAADTVTTPKDAGVSSEAQPASDAAFAVDIGLSPVDTAGPPSGPESFAGKWVYDEGMAQLNCPGQTALKEVLDDAFLTFEIGAGVAPLILTAPGCNLRFDIKGATAVIQPGQSCMNPIAGLPATAAATAFTFTLQGTRAQQSATWTVTFAAMPGMPCTMTSEGSLVLRP